MLIGLRFKEGRLIANPSVTERDFPDLIRCRWHSIGVKNKQTHPTITHLIIKNEGGFYKYAGSVRELMSLVEPFNWQEDSLDRVKKRFRNEAIAIQNGLYYGVWRDRPDICKHKECLQNRFVMEFLAITNKGSAISDRVFMHSGDDDEYSLGCPICFPYLLDGSEITMNGIYDSIVNNKDIVRSSSNFNITAAMAEELSKRYRYAKEAADSLLLTNGSKMDPATLLIFLL